jgi:glycosyltransferase involved in cell wall biosynthesis
LNYYIVIPAHNEANFIDLTLNSIVKQTILPKQVVVVNDNSTDNTAEIIKEYSKKHSFIQLVNNQSDTNHLPGSKVINAFYKGFNLLDSEYDFIVKLDADIILPTNYFETVINHFNNDSNIGMCGGFAYIKEGDNWVLENLTNKDHIRGAFKAYRKKCFLDIDKLKPSMGWDTVDELLAQFHGWKIKTDETLKAKHLKPTGKVYNKIARYKQGEAFYKLDYGFLLTTIASLKLAFLKKQPFLFFDYIIGYLKASSNNTTKLVNSKEGEFIRSLRWKGVKQKLF